MNRLSHEKQADIISNLVEGVGMRATGRLVEVELKTVSRNLVWVGEACQRFHDETVKDLKCTRVEADELWSFVWAKNKNLPPALVNNPEYGEMYTWLSMDPDSRLGINWHVGKRELTDALRFAHDLAWRIPGRIQITTDQLNHYRTAIEDAFGSRVDYATIRKVMSDPPMTPDKKYEQPELKTMRRASVMGSPNPDLATTTHIERMNLHIRSSLKRYARSTNAYSRKLRNNKAALALHFVYSNFVRIHPQIRVTPAMEAGLTDHIWSINDIVNLVPRSSASFSFEG